MDPCSIKIFLFDGDPSGIRIAQISMSTIQAVAFRRNQFGFVSEKFPELKTPGVYILIGADDNEMDRQFAYVGESENVFQRLSYHNSNETGQDAKPFWTDTVVLISKDQNLTKSHARYVESCLIRSVGGNPRWSLPNRQEPSDDAGKLPLPDQVDMGHFVDQAKTLVGALGWDMFRDMRGQAAETGALVRDLRQDAIVSGPRFFCSGDGFEAQMEVGRSGDFVVKGGSKARVRTTETIQPSTIALRDMLKEKGVLREDGDFLVFTSDYSFSSVSAAAGTVYGGSVSGRASWKLEDGSSYADWESNQEMANRKSDQIPETGAD